MESLATLAPLSSPCSALEITRSVPTSPPIIIRLSNRGNSRGSRGSWRIHAISLAFEVQTSVRGKEARRRSRRLNVELEILRFMEQSGKPNEFPTKEELIAAGRSDLVEAAIKRGGWLTLGWQESNDKENRPKHSKDTPVSRINGTGRDSHHDVYGGVRGGNAESMHAGVETSKRELPAELVLEKESSSGTQQSYEDDSPRLTKNVENGFPSTTGTSSEAEPPSLIQSVGRRRLSRSTSQKENLKTENVPIVEASHERWRRKRRKETKKLEPDNTSVRNALGWIQDMVQMREQWLLESISKPSKQQILTRSSKTLDAPAKSHREASSTRAHLTRSSSSASKTGDSPSLQKTSDRSSFDPRLISKEASSSLSKEPASDDNSFNSRLRKLEAKLLATRAALKCGRAALLKGEDKLMQVQRKTGEEIAKAADTLEFRENDLMQTRAELRRTRAQVTALQAKMALELSEARKATEEKQRQLEKAEKALGMMRLVRIVWPNPASHVLLTGSFDGWTNKIKMERSSAGVFVTSLHLYPGRYEVKFVVDGTWRVDACRPITYSDGIENNLLMVT